VRHVSGQSFWAKPRHEARARHNGVAGDDRLKLKARSLAPGVFGDEGEQLAPAVRTASGVPVFDVTL
jgi:hypothetical protein